jgi:ABC-type multidrug transport system fused ATPase/permease subunit
VYDMSGFSYDITDVVHLLQLRVRHKNSSSMDVNITLILISHRINVIADSDCIYVLQKGNIVARGTDKQLKEQCKLYRQLYGEEEK